MIRNYPNNSFVLRLFAILLLVFGVSDVTRLSGSDLAHDCQNRLGKLAVPDCLSSPVTEPEGSPANAGGSERRSPMKKAGLQSSPAYSIIKGQAGMPVLL